MQRIYFNFYWKVHFGDIRVPMLAITPSSVRNTANI
jgi:hypothetical protein